MGDHQKKKKKFLNLPKYVGGSAAFKEFIAKNLQYPAEALASRVEGIVTVEYDIDDDGFVHNPRILRSLGYGCDEEAMRVVSLLRFEKVRNRGVRVTLTTRTNIRFTLPLIPSVQYTIVWGEKEKPLQSSQTGNTHEVYNYTITLQPQ